MKPIVTVAVTSYFSAPYILETLESIYSQTYQDIALIISDDCSKDDTVGIVQKWVAQERVKNRFQSIEVITVPQNTGVSANCNRCLNAIKTEWFKFIAGDDILYPNCIEDNMDFVAFNPEAHIVFSQVELYQNEFQEQNYIKTTPYDYPNNLMDEKLSAKDQYHLLLLTDRIHYTPSFFSNKMAILAVGGYDESNRLVEDYPMWLKLTRTGIRLHYFHKVTVGYRIHDKATNNNGEDFLFKPSIFNTFQIRKKFAYPHLPWEMVASECQVYWVSKFFQSMGWNKKGSLTNNAYKMGCFYLNPFHYVYAFKKRIATNKNNPFYR